VRPLRLLLLPLLLPLSASPLLADEDYGKVLDRFAKQFAKGDLDARVRAFDLLDPGNPQSLPPLRDALLADHWFLRGEAAKRLSTVTDPALRAQLRLDLLTHEETRVREGIALAFLLSPEKGDGEALVEALADARAIVRRTAAFALAEIVSKESIGALIGALRNEKDSHVAVAVADTLAKVTGLRFGRDAAAWHEWWEKNAGKALAGLEEEKKRRELGGIPIETVTVPSRRPGDPTAEKIDILVLAPFGFTHDVFRPWLDELSRFARVTYVKLPRLDELTGSSGYGSAVPEYPVAALVKALEELREELGKRKVVLLAEGAAGWIAERYAVSHYDRTAALVILNGYLDAPAYGAALSRLARSPTPAERFVAETLMNQNDVPHDRAAYRAIARVLLTADLSDPFDSWGYLLWTKAQDPQGFASVPDLRFGDRVKIEIPACFFFGAGSRLTGFPEAPRIREHFPNNVIAVMAKSRGFPYLSEYDEFYRVLEGFLAYYGLIPAPK
jgi:pimeloyl-ACP methyl ester carboxylesterase